MPGDLTRVPCEGGVQIAVHHLGGKGPSLVLLAANGFMPQVYLPMVILVHCAVSKVCS